MKRNLIICGAPFTGTTLLAFLLGEHPQVANSGEFMCLYCHLYPVDGGEQYRHEFFGRRPLGPTHCEDRSRCRFDKRNPCGVWDSYRPPPPKNIYSHLREYLKADAVIDVSKHGEWYQNALATEERSDDETLIIMIHKPVWGHVRSQGHYQRRSEGFTHMNDPEFCQKHAQFWANWHVGFRPLVDRYDSVFVRYEDLASSPVETTRYIWGVAGLAETYGLPSTAATSWMSQHPIDGNYRLCEKVMKYAQAGAKVPIELDTRDQGMTPEARAAMLEVPDAAAAMEWLGR